MYCTLKFHVSWPRLHSLAVIFGGTVRNSIYNSCPWVYLDYNRRQYNIKSSPNEILFSKWEESKCIQDATPFWIRTDMAQITIKWIRYINGSTPTFVTTIIITQCRIYIRYRPSKMARVREMTTPGVMPSLFYLCGFFHNFSQLKVLGWLKLRNLY